MLVKIIGLGEIPNRSCRLVIASTSEDGGTCVLIGILIGPLPDIPDEILYAKRAGAARMRVYRVGA
jgi:hypothetical protein